LGSLIQKYPNVAERAVSAQHKYMCKTGFSRYAKTKAKSGNRLNAASDWKLSSPATPLTLNGFPKKNKNTLLIEWVKCMQYKQVAFIASYFLSLPHL
jgi:hypothetical protein